MWHRRASFASKRSKAALKPCPALTSTTCRASASGLRWRGAAPCADWRHEVSVLTRLDQHHHTQSHSQGETEPNCHCYAYWPVSPTMLLTPTIVAICRVDIIA